MTKTDLLSHQDSSPTQKWLTSQIDGGVPTFVNDSQKAASVCDLPFNGSINPESLLSGFRSRDTLSIVGVFLRENSNELLFPDSVLKMSTYW